MSRDHDCEECRDAREELTIRLVQDYDIPIAEDYGEVYLHCNQCIEELIKKAGAEKCSVSPRDYAKLSVAFTEVGLQVWCNRHNKNILHMDLEGRSYRVNHNMKADPLN